MQVRLDNAKAAGSHNILFNDVDLADKLFLADCFEVGYVAASKLLALREEKAGNPAGKLSEENADYVGQFEALIEHLRS